MNNPKISLVCTTFNSADSLPAFLKSLEKLPSEGLEIIFVDNHSADSTVELVRKWGKSSTLIQNDRNRGWSTANNQGLKVSRGEYIFFANPDIWFEPKDLPHLARFLDERREFAAAAPQLLNPDGSIQSSCRRLPKLADMLFQMTGLAFLFPESAFNRWKMPEFDHASLREVEQPMASAFLVRGETFESLGGFDERFFVFFGDVDFCRRLKEAGLRVAFYPEPKFFHRRGAATRQMGAAFYFSSHLGFYRYLWKWSNLLQKLLLLFLLPLALLTAVGRAAAAPIFRR